MFYSEVKFLLSFKTNNQTNTNTKNQTIKTKLKKKTQTLYFEQKWGNEVYTQKLKIKENVFVFKLTSIKLYKTSDKATNKYTLF